MEFDYIILAYDDEEKYKLNRDIFLEIFPSKKIINYEIFKLPYINLEKYFDLISNVPTIFSNNCLGGVLTYSLKLPVKSPFVNLWLNDGDYMKFLNNPQKYLNSNIEPYGFEMDEFSDKLKKYPKCLCGDIVLNCTHYRNHKEVIDKWNNRSKRIDFDNLFVIYTAKDEKYIQEFIQLPYKRKVCLCAFEYAKDDKYIKQIDLGKSIDYTHWFFYVLAIFRNRFPLINIVDFVHDGEIVKFGEKGNLFP